MLDEPSSLCVFPTTGKAFSPLDCHESNYPSRETLSFVFLRCELYLILRNCLSSAAESSVVVVVASLGDCDSCGAGLVVSRSIELNQELRRAARRTSTAAGKRFGTERLPVELQYETSECLSMGMNVYFRRFPLLRGGATAVSWGGC